MADADALRDAGVPAIPVTPGSTPPPDAAPPTAPDGSVMTLIDHLGELRTRLFRSILAVAVGSTIGFYFSKHDPRLPDRPAAHGARSRARHRAGPRARRRVRHPAQDLDRLRRDRGDAGPALPAVGLRRRRGSPRPRRRPSARGSRWRCSSSRSASRSPTSCSRSRSSSSCSSPTTCSSRAIAAGPFFEFVTTMFLAFGLDHGVPDRHGRAVARRDPDLGAPQGLAPHGDPRDRGLRGRSRPPAAT